MINRPPRRAARHSSPRVRRRGPPCSRRSGRFLQQRCPGFLPPLPLLLLLRTGRRRGATTRLAGAPRTRHGCRRRRRRAVRGLGCGKRAPGAPRRAPALGGGLRVSSEPFCVPVAGFGWRGRARGRPRAGAGGEGGACGGRCVGGRPGRGRPQPRYNVVVLASLNNRQQKKKLETFLMMSMNTFFFFLKKKTTPVACALLFFSFLFFSFFFFFRCLLFLSSSSSSVCLCSPSFRFSMWRGCGA